MKKYNNEIINNLLSENFTIEQIKAALCDGAFIAEAGYSQEDVEAAYNEINE
jgi:hypothetical protein